MINLKSKKVLLPVIAAIALLAIVAGVFSPIAALADPTAKTMPQITGSVNVKDTMKNYIKEHTAVSFSEAATTAEKQIINGSVVGGHVGIVQGYLVYTFCVIDTQNDTGYMITIDAGDGKVLYKSDGITMKGGEFGGPFGHGMPGFGHGSFGHSHEFGKMMKNQNWSDNTDSTTPQSQ